MSGGRVTAGHVRMRAAAVGDAAKLAALLEELGYPTPAAELGERLQQLCADPASTLLVAAMDGDIVGLAAAYVVPHLERAKPTCRLTALVVAEAARERGIGRKLLDAISVAARRAGCDRIELTSRPDRAEAARFYASVGFVETPRRLLKELGR